MTPKKLLSIISHRTVLVAVMLLLQVGIFVAAILRFSEYFVYFYLLCVLVCALYHQYKERSGL